ncbi:Os01g0499350 [Oryza sativa Japonica Group]|uniref:Os01g0499350 protein n=1 Tax=Oryza sativa subsp. japonica TaxID=39947 RepID=A0A0P0V2X8_ORYSJ|nr:Os01g0499350 [Oryza sativa Japonica Group]
MGQVKGTLRRIQQLCNAGLIGVAIACNFVMQKVQPLKSPIHPTWEPFDKDKATGRITSFFEPGTAISTKGCPKLLYCKSTLPGTENFVSNPPLLEMPAKRSTTDAPSVERPFKCLAAKWPATGRSTMLDSRTKDHHSCAGEGEANC